MTGSSVFGCFGLTFAFVGERLFCILLVVSLYNAITALAILSRWNVWVTYFALEEKPA